MGNNTKGSGNGDGSNGGIVGDTPRPALIHFPESDPEQVARDRIRLRKPRGDVDVNISQEDLERERLLTRRSSDALRRLRRHREDLLWRLFEYGPDNVEKGGRTMDAILVRTEPKISKGSTYYRLYVK